MNSIGFKNFRRFSEFNPIQLKEINFLVGRNNSGKSTMVKALMLVKDFLASDSIKTFSFSKTNVENVNIVTFGRAKCRSVQNSDVISFDLELKNLKFLLTVSGQDDNTTVDVQTLLITDMNTGFYFDLNPRNSSATIGRTSSYTENVDGEKASFLADLLESEKDLKKTTQKIKEKLSPEFIQANNQLIGIKAKIKSVRSDLKRGDINSGNYGLTTFFTKSSVSEVMDEVISVLWAEYKVQYHDIQRNKKPKKNFEHLKAFNDDKFKIDQVTDNINTQISRLSLIYLGAVLNKQSALFAIRDKENALAQSIHEYKQLGIDSAHGSDAYKFVQRWIKEDGFEIGESIKIDMHAGEAYEVSVLTNGVMIPLADKGMGSIQAMLLILRLATVIFKRQKYQLEYTVIIEEPELNLHPALQSKLATLFHSVSKEFGIQFIIETHSEYLIRKTQLIVKNDEYERSPNYNPFNVIYFDKEPVQWNMNYRTDGRFVDKFGSGFFDVSANLTFELL